MLFIKLRVTQSAMERSMVGIKKRDERRENGVKDSGWGSIEWTWAVHIAKLGSNRWVKILTEWFPGDQKRMRQDLEEGGKTIWKRWLDHAWGQPKIDKNGAPSWRPMSSNGTKSYALKKEENIYFYKWTLWDAWCIRFVNKDGYY